MGKYMKIKEILQERILNLTSPAEKQKYVDIVWDMLQKSYANVGGFLSAADKQTLIDTTSLWKLVRRNKNEITAVNLYRDQFGKKTMASGTNGTRQGLIDYRTLKNDDARLKRSWCEASGPVEKMLDKTPGMNPIPNKYAAYLTGKEILSLNDDGYHYTRMIMGEPHQKKLYGSLKINSNSLQTLEKFGLKLEDLPENFRLSPK